MQGINGKAEHELLLKICLCGAFYPNYLETDSIDLKTVSNSLLHHDPYCSVSINLSQHKKLPSEALIKPLTKCLNNYGLIRRMSFLQDRVVVEFQNIRNTNETSILGATYPTENDFECKTRNIKVLLTDSTSAKVRNRLQLDKPILTDFEKSRLKGKTTYMLDLNNYENEDRSVEYFSNANKMRQLKVNRGAFQTRQNSVYAYKL